MGALNDLPTGTCGDLAIRWSLVLVVAAGGVAAIFYALAERELA
jgi:hypothetical protein